MLSIDRRRSVVLLAVVGSGFSRTCGWHALEMTTSDASAMKVRLKADPTYSLNVLLTELVQGLVDLGEIGRVGLRRTRLARTRRKQCFAVLAEGDALFLLAVVELHDDHHERFVEAGLGRGLDEGARAHVRQPTQHAFDLVFVGIGRV